MLGTSACPSQPGCHYCPGQKLSSRPFRHPLMVGPGCMGRQHAATAPSQTSGPGPPRPPHPQGLFTAAGPRLPFYSIYPSMPDLGRCDRDAENLTCSKSAIKSKSKGKTPTQTDSTCQPSLRSMLVPQWRGLGARSRLLLPCLICPGLLRHPQYRVRC